MEAVRRIAALGLTALLMIFLCRKTSLFQNRGKKMVKEARASGRVVVATLAKTQWLYPGWRSETGAKRRNNSKGQWRCTYVYDFRGIRREYTTTFIGSYPETLDLYYPQGQPEKAMYSRDAVNRPGCVYCLMFFAPWVLYTVIYSVLCVFM